MTTAEEQRTKIKAILKELADISASLILWFKSQDIGPTRATDAMVMLIAATIANRSKTPEEAAKRVTEVEDLLAMLTVHLLEIKESD